MAFQKTDPEIEKRIADLKERGLSLQKIADQLTSEGNKITKAGVQNVLKRISGDSKQPETKTEQTKPHKGGRKPKGEEKLTKKVSIAFTPEEYQILESKTLGVMPVATFIRFELKKAGHLD